MKFRISFLRAGKIIRFLVTLILLTFTVFCNKSKARYPLNKKDKVFLNKSAERNKILLAREEFMIKKAANLDTILNYITSETGFLYSYINKASNEQRLPSKGERVSFKYHIQNLDKKIIYNQVELGTIDYIVDQEDILPALREGIRIMRPGDVVVFLFPSYLCYGFQGDGDKIGVNEPLRFTIELLTKN